MKFGAHDTQQEVFGVLEGKKKKILRNLSHALLFGIRLPYQTTLAHPTRDHWSYFRNLQVHFSLAQCEE